MAKKYFKKCPEYICERISKAGTHSLQINIRHKSGKTFRKSIRIDEFSTPKEAMDFAKKLKNDVLQKMDTGYTVKTPTTVKELFDKSFELLPVRIKTKDRHSAFYNKGIAKYGNVRITDIKRADVQASINEYACTHTKRQTQGLLSIWRRIYDTCALLEISVIDRTKGVKIPECVEGKPRPKTISPEDLQIFLDALLDYNSASLTGSYYCHAIYYGIQIMRYCGLRPAETFGLLKDDINLITRTISINKAIHSTQESRLDFGKTKTEKSVRLVPIPDALFPILKECLEWSRNDILLADYQGNLIPIDDIDCTIAHIRKKRKTPYFTMYMLRHGFSTDMFAEGVNPAVIRDLMGHTSSTMSLDYAVSSEADRVTAINNRKFS